MLAPGGRCSISCFLLEPESLALIEAASATLDLRHVRDGYRIVDEQSPEKTVAHDEKLFWEMFAQHGLEVVGSIKRGSWCGRPSGGAYQDEIVAIEAG